MTDGTLARVSEAAEEALARATFAVDDALEKAVESATGKVLRHKERKESKRSRKRSGAGDRSDPQKD